MIKKFFSSGFITWLAILGLGAGLGYQFLHNDKIESSQLQTLSEANSKQQEALQQITAILSTHDKQFQQIADHNNQLVAALKELDLLVRGDSQVWRFNQVQNFIEMAMVQAVLLNDTTTAISLLAAADNILKNIDNPNLIPVRKALQVDISALASNPASNLNNIILTLGNITDHIAQLPHKIPLNKNQANEHSNQSTEGQTWEHRAQTVWQEIKSLIRIQRHDEPITPYFSQDDTALINENLSLMLEQAGFAAARHYSMLYKQELNRAQAWVKQYYDQNDPTVQAVLQNLAHLETLSVSNEATIHLKTVDAWTTFLSTKSGGK